ncbi:endothelin-converting enzyme 2-like [Dendronephthya gigantea]|uniref:endothelin-converting enzyme 2-like n=1 Tax=Dendronephthya gigantea TaxID=151771 RepID=UPI00106A2B25|nr:endothelin-converting enzyme 2-like [Dendronephthya gigantea]
MPSVPSYTLLQPELTRKPSKARLILAIFFLVLLVLLVVFISLYVVAKNKTTSEGHSNGTPTIWPTASTKTCNTIGCVVSAADILNKLDQSADPCEHFYQYSCGGFVKKSYIPDGESYIDSITASNDFIQYTLRDLFQNKQLQSNYSVDPSSAVYKAFVFYKSCMDVERLEIAGDYPIRQVIEKYGSCSITNNKWSEDTWVLEKILARVLADTGVPVFLDVDIKQSFLNTSEIYVSIGGGHSGYDNKQLEREKWDSRKLELKLNKENGIPTNDVDDYKKLMSTIFKLLGTNSLIDYEVNRLVNLEDSFLKVRETLDLSDVDAIKNKITFMTLEELNKLTSLKFNWKVYLEEIFKGTKKSIASDQKLMIIMPNNIKSIVNWLADKPKSLLANEVIWSVVRTFIDNLPKAFRKARQEYYLTYGLQTTPRWKACNALADKYFTHATTLLFVNKHVKDDTLKKVADMFSEIKAEFVDGLKEQKWMDKPTRAQARLKLNKMKDWIGFPSIVKNATELNNYYNRVEVSELLLLQNALNSIRDMVIKKIDRLGKPPDDSRFSMSPLSVNAYYSFQANGITILAGILQPPFYKDATLKALSYGSLGMFVGHEITHAFDKQGSEYDENGNIRQWWTKASHGNFVKRSECLIKQYNNVTISGFQVNGTKTLSENIADNGGLKYAYRAYQKWRRTHGDEDRLPALSLDNNQLFFVSFAQTWCAKYTKKAVKILISIDDHSPDAVRVRVPIHNFPEFSTAFGCPPRNNTCAVW